MLPEFKVIKYLEWCTELPSGDCPQESPVFSVNNNEFFFQLVLEESEKVGDFFSSWYYDLYLEFKSGNPEFKSCSGNFQVGFKSEQTLSLSAKEGFTISEPGRKEMWSIHFQIIQRKLPSDYMSGNCIKFLFCFDDMTESLLDITKETGHISPDLQLKDSNFCLESLSRDFGKMLHDGVDHDVEFKCDDHTWKVHKNVLGIRSKVLQAMLNSDMIEGRTGVITLRDMDTPTAQYFLNYLYTGKLPEMSVETAKRFYEIGDKYAVDCLKKSCGNYLARNLTPEIACEILIIAHERSDSSLKESVMNFITVKRICMNDDIWCDFCQAHPMIACEVYRQFCKTECSS